MGKIYAKGIGEIPGYKFRQVRINGEVLSPIKFKESIKKLVRGGASLTEVDRKLKELRVPWGKRQETLKLIQGGNKIKKSATLSEVQEKQNLNRYMQRDVSVLEEKHRRTERKALGILGRGPSEKSTAARLV
ncbi:MAG: hypothetical protein ABH830_01730, partial [Patescibacteria group bacterium]